MSDDLNFETFLYISKKKIIVLVFKDMNDEIYKNELIFNYKFDKINLNLLNDFLDQNIFKIEKSLKGFINKISIIIDSNEFFPVEMSIGKIINENSFNLNNLYNLLKEAKDCIQKTIDNKTIIHMLINSYKIDNKHFSNFPKEINGNTFSLDLKFICLPNIFIDGLETILKKYHISLNHIVSADYVKNFSNGDGDEKNIFFLAKKLISGLNPNEVKLINKTKENQGFFEKFFNFFN